MKYLRAVAIMLVLTACAGDPHHDSRLLGKWQEMKYPNKQTDIVEFYADGRVSYPQHSPPPGYKLVDVTWKSATCISKSECDLIVTFSTEVFDPLDAEQWKVTFSSADSASWQGDRDEGSLERLNQ